MLSLVMRICSAQPEHDRSKVDCRTVAVERLNMRADEQMWCIHQKNRLFLLRFQRNVSHVIIKRIYGQGSSIHVYSVSEGM